MNKKAAITDMIMAFAACVMIGAAVGGWRGVVLGFGVWMLVSVLKNRKSDYS